MKKDVLIYFDIITSIKTTEEASNLSAEIDTLMLTLFKSQKMSLDKALDLIPKDTAKKILQTFSKNNLDINDKELIRGFLNTLKNLMKKFKIIKLIIAFDPTRKTIEKIHSFVSENIGIGYILDFETDPGLLGGAVVIFNGKYSDFTVKKRLEEIFSLRSKEIMQAYK